MATATTPGALRLLVIIPAYNEGAVIGKTIDSLKALSFPYDVAVVNDGSTDDTAQAARMAGATVIDLACNIGVGGAMQTGYQYAHLHGYDAAVQFDGDGQHCTDQIPALLAPIAAGQADMVIGSRFLGAGDYRFSVERLIGSRLLAALASGLTRRRITDPTSGFRAANRRAIRFFSRHYPQSWLGDTVEALVELARHGFSVQEVPAKMQPRQHGQSTVGRIAGFIHTLRITVAVLIDCMERKFDDDTTQGEP